MYEWYDKDEVIDDLMCSMHDTRSRQLAIEAIEKLDMVKLFCELMLETDYTGEEERKEQDKRLRHFAHLTHNMIINDYNKEYTEDDL